MDFGTRFRLDLDIAAQPPLREIVVSEIFLERHRNIMRRPGVEVSGEYELVRFRAPVSVEGIKRSLLPRLSAVATYTDLVGLALGYTQPLDGPSVAIIALGDLVSYNGWKVAPTLLMDIDGRLGIFPTVVDIHVSSSAYRTPPLVGHSVDGTASTFILPEAFRYTSPICLSSELLVMTRTPWRKGPIPGG